MNVNVTELIVTAAICVAGFSAYKAYQASKSNEDIRAKLDAIDERINKTVDNVANGIDISVDEPIVREAVEKAVNREVKEQVKDACNTAIANVRIDIQSRIRQAVDNKKESLEDDVESEIKKQIGSIDISKAKNKVIKEASEKAADKFNTELDDILGNYKGTLSNVSKIYQSISDAVAKPAAQGINPGGKSPVILSL